MTDDQFLKYMDYQKKDIRSIVKKAVQKKYNVEPKFYAISGSHIYGFPSKEGSDIDVRGFHLADAEKYATLDTPKEQIIINQSENPTQGFEHVKEVELVSYELKKFGELIYKTNFNVLEFLFHGPQIMNGEPLAIDSLKQIIRDYLPADVPYHYRGMAKTNYHKFLNPESGSYRPKAKKFLYVIRGLLAAQYVQEEADIEPDINILAKRLSPEGEKTVQKLIEVKKNHEFEETPEELREDAHKLISQLFNNLEIDENVEKESTELKQAVNDWMLKVRE